MVLQTHNDMEIPADKDFYIILRYLTFFKGQVNTLLTRVISISSLSRATYEMKWKRLKRRGNTEEGFRITSNTTWKPTGL